ncbi:MAG: hypothetical protein STSR0004_18070 [Peptococcaceae bacterium]
MNKRFRIKVAVKYSCPAAHPKNLDSIPEEAGVPFFSYFDIIDIDGLKERQLSLVDIPLDTFDQVKTPGEFKKIVYDEAIIKKIGDACKTLQDLHHFHDMYAAQLEKEVEYAREVRRVLEEYPGLFQVEDLKLPTGEGTIFK